MKKLMLIVSAAMMIGAVSAQAQSESDEPSFGVGINAGVAPVLESGETPTNVTIGARVFYDLNRNMRLGVDFDYGLKNKDWSCYDFMLNFQYRFNLSQKFAVYPMVGLGYAHLKYDWVGALKDDWDFDFDYDYSFANRSRSDWDYDDDLSLSKNKFAFQAGLGLEYMFSDKFGVNLEAKYQYIKDFNRLPISIGFTYKF